MAKAYLGTRIAAVYELHAAWMEPRLEKMGVSWATFQLLTAVSGAGDKASQTEVASRIGVTAPTLSESVQIHVEKGLLVQTRSKTDKRVKILKLTPRSEAMVKEIRELVLKSEETMTKGVLPGELSSTVKVLERVLLNLETALDNDSPA